MRLCLVFAAVVLAPLAAHAAPYDTLVLAWSPSGDLALVQETAQTKGGGTTLGYRVVGPGVLQKHYVISEEKPDAGGALLQKIGFPECRDALVELRDLLRKKKFKGITLSSEACMTGERSAAVVASPEQAAESEAAELPRSSTGDVFERDAWQVLVEPEAVTIADGASKKKLRLPRAIHPANAHVLLSPSRKLMLVLSSQPNGDQILVAGFSSKSGGVAEFE
jgi:hypothetical protein